MLKKKESLHASLHFDIDEEGEAGDFSA